MGKQNTKSKPNGDLKPVFTDFGTRKVLTQNFSRLVALPKTALANCGFNRSTMVSIQLVQQDGEKFIKLSPVAEKTKEVVSS